MDSIAQAASIPHPRRSPWGAVSRVWVATREAFWVALESLQAHQAIGARRSDITWQFLLEAMTLTAAGGLLGILAAVLISTLIRTFVTSLPSSVPVWAVAAGFIVSVGIGLIFGMWPAVKASRLDPIVALRYE